jgi:hypothetical protein
MNTKRLMITAAFLAIAGIRMALAQELRDLSAKPVTEGVTRLPVVFSGGHDTDPVDHGRPVVLIAAALGVKTEVFRDAFSRVHPADPERGPTAERAQANKAALLSALGKYGITNERLDEVSNFYRYRPGEDRLWKHTPAVAHALVKDGIVVGYEIITAGAGYSSSPKVIVPGIKNANARAEIAFGKDLKTNGKVSVIRIAAVPEGQN